jgi:hypothetical protein
MQGLGMIRKSENRLSEKIMRKLKDENHDAIELNRIMIDLPHLMPNPSRRHKCVSATAAMRKMMQIPMPGHPSRGWWSRHRFGREASPSAISGG